MNRLYFGDNLTVLKDCINDESVDLVYLDPPFNSQATYNVIFRGPAGEMSKAQIEAFEDTWHWGDEAELAFDGVITSGNSEVAEILRSMRAFLKENDMMAYLSMMAVRLLELHRVLKQTGSIYLHCDPSASHYLKVLMDGIFGITNFRNEIIWKRNSAHSDNKQGAKHFGRLTDTIFFYSKGDDPTWNPIYRPYDQEYIDRDYRRVDPDGRRWRLDNIQGPGGAEKGNPFYEVMGVERHWRYSREKMQQLIDEGRIIQTRPGTVPQYKRYLDEMPGVSIQNLWDDIPVINNRSKELLGYPTQKPLALLERIITVSSNEGDVILDPFCGCGTAIHAAHKLKRQWIGIDITHLAISLIEERLTGAFPGIKYAVEGVPKDLEGARDLAERDKHQFQLWAGSRIKAVPFRSGKKGADSGIDGIIYFKPEGKTTEKAIVSVKGGENVNVAMVRDLGHVVDREKAKIGVFVTLAEPTGPMKTEAVKAGYYETPYGKYPKLQILTIKDLFDGKHPNIPLVDSSSFKRAEKEKVGDQDVLF
jgi:DNA modification methylase